MIVVSDTSPIRGLISIGKIHLLKDLFGSVFIPTAVKEELYRIKAINFDKELLLKQDWIKVVDMFKANKNSKNLKNTLIREKARQSFWQKNSIVILS